MKAILAFVIVLAVAIFLWAAVVYITSLPRPRRVTKEPWIESMEQLMNMQGGSVVPSHLAGMTHAIANSLEKLSDKIERSTESTERLGKVNLLLVCVIAVATLAYAIATWLQVTGSR